MTQEEDKVIVCAGKRPDSAQVMHEFGTNLTVNCSILATGFDVRKLLY